MLGIFQGESFARNYSSASVATFDATWVGKWTLSLNGVSALSGDLVPNVDETKLQLRLHPSQTVGLAPATYILITEISNDLLDFKQETQELLLVKAKGF